MRVLTSALAVSVLLAAPGALSASLKPRALNDIDAVSSTASVDSIDSSSSAASSGADILSATDPAYKPNRSGTSESLSTTSTSSLADSASSPSTTPGSRFNCLYPDGVSNLYAEHVNAKSAVFKCLMGTKCYQATDDNSKIKCAYPSSQDSSPGTTTVDSSTSAAGTALSTQSELGQTNLGFHNNRFAQVPLDSILSSLAISVTPTPGVDDERIQEVPTSSEPRVLSINVILPTFAIRVTDDINMSNVVTVLTIDPNTDTPALATTSDSSAEGLEVEKAASAISAIIPAPLPSPLLSLSPSLSTLPGTTKPIPIFGAGGIASRKAVGRVAMDIPDPVTVESLEQTEFIQSMVTRTVESAKPVGRQMHAITIDDYDLAGILRMTNLASMASRLLLASAVPDLDTPAAPISPPTMVGPVFSVPTLPPLSPLTPSHVMPQPVELPPAHPVLPPPPPPRPVRSPPPPPPPPPMHPQPVRPPPPPPPPTRPNAPVVVNAYPPQISDNRRPNSYRPPTHVSGSSVSPAASSQDQIFSPQPLPFPQQSVGGIEYPFDQHQSVVPMSSSPFNIVPAASTRAFTQDSVLNSAVMMSPLNMQDSNTQRFTPIIPFITDGTRREVPTPQADAASNLKSGINASGIASILEDVFHIPPSAISIDGKPLVAGHRNGANGESDDEGDIDDDSDEDNNKDSKPENTGLPQDLEEELQSRLGVAMNRNRDRNRFRAHIKIVGAPTKHKAKSVHRGSTLLRALDDGGDSDSEDSDGVSTESLSQSTKTAVLSSDSARSTIKLVEVSSTSDSVLDNGQEFGFEMTIVDEYNTNTQEDVTNNTSL
ncbi:hypothetical protein LPJ53_001199 [Coemansia erecta]|uniref:Chitin-binding type-2 domain-containing protein n=1 Tax=Coemansia erecta TaxID=147472 RepID=A0A9W7Y5X9_9FUNG|nr:hypothetical protein LPJ53_001199 [Coemansia erecta]